MFHILAQVLLRYLGLVFVKSQRKKSIAKFDHIGTVCIRVPAFQIGSTTF
jgi:hypothetical protein